MVELIEEITIGLVSYHCYVYDVSFTCFTSERELEDLEQFFYEVHNVSRENLEFISFDLYEQTENQNIFQSLKDIKKYEKKSDRCYEIQYNKFYWIKKYRRK